MISLFYKDGIAYVWNHTDWHELRSKYRICGSLIGGLVTFPRQNDFLGLPMALMVEETILLLEKNVCELYELPEITHTPSEDQKQNADELDNRLFQEQVETFQKRKIEQLSQKIDIIIAGKKQKMLSKGDSGNVDINFDKQAMLQEEINKLVPLTTGQVLVQIPTEHPWPTARKKITLTELKLIDKLDRKGEIRYTVFKDLWEKGHHVTSGSKFGVDFLVYPGDPVRFHAMFMVQCLNDVSTALRPANLVALGRLSVAVNKLAVLASCDNHQQIHYQTLQWHDSLTGSENVT